MYQIPQRKQTSGHRFTTQVFLGSCTDFVYVTCLSPGGTFTMAIEVGGEPYNIMNYSLLVP